MKRQASSILLLLAAALGALQSCKTTEENYRSAYERAIDGRSDSADSTIYTAARRHAQGPELVAGDISTSAKTQWVALTPDGGGDHESIKRYCVVAGEFKQEFNALSMRQRLADSGYASAFVVQDHEPFYYVVAFSSDDLEIAMAEIAKLRSQPPFPLREGMPIILQPAQIK